MRRGAFSTGLLGAAVLFGAAALARADGAMLSYAPMAHSHSGQTETPAHEGLKHFDVPADRVCFKPSEAHDKILSHKLTEPFQALRLGQWHGEALRARLCRWAPEKFVYEIAVLRRDGRIVHVYMNAQTGQNVGGQKEPSEPDDDPQGE